VYSHSGYSSEQKNNKEKGYQERILVRDAEKAYGTLFAALFFHGFPLFSQELIQYLETRLEKNGILPLLPKTTEILASTLPHVENF